MMWTNLDEDFVVKIGADMSPVDINKGVLFAAGLLIILYGLIIFEVVHRTFAAVMVSTMSVAVLAFLDDRPTFHEIIEYINVETLLLLFSMMILVAMLTETGIFDYIAVYTYKVTNGKIWPLIHGLCIITVIVSAFLDDVTTVLLMTPITIRLCEVMELNPTPVLMGIIVHANIGGSLTPVGDPSNIIITSDNYIAKHASPKSFFDDFSTFYDQFLVDFFILGNHIYEFHFSHDSWCDPGHLSDLHSTPYPFS